MLLAALVLFINNPKTIIFIIFVLVLFFGAKRIPELFKGVGQGVREFKDASRPEDQSKNGYAQQNPNYPPQNQQYGPQNTNYPPQHQHGYVPQQPTYNPQAPNQMPQAPYNTPNYPTPNDQPAS